MKCVIKCSELIKTSFNEESIDYYSQCATFYIQHYQAMHGNLPPEYMDKELFICDECPQIFITKVSFAAHKVNVHR